MPTDPKSGHWTPNLSPRQREVYECNKRYILSSGPRICGKTRGSLHRIVRHCWEVDNARFAMFTKLKKQALSGVWPLLTNKIIKEWLEADLGSPHGEFKYTVAPRELGAVRMNYLKLENYWGGESEIQLHSLDYDNDVEEKIMSTEFSGFYFSELQHFHKPLVFSTVIQSLRMSDVPYEKHIWIADTNPPLEGPRHFAYKIWFEDRTARTPEGNSQIEQMEFLAYQKDLALFEYTLDDAIFADPRMVAQLKATYRNDPEGWARFVEGKWTWTTGHDQKHFSRLFRRSVHVLGSIESSDRSQWELINPDDSTTELFVGWDIGKINHAMAIAQKRLTEDGKVRWEFLEELVSLAEKVSTEEFTMGALEKIDAMERLVGHPVIWTHWSDTSAFEFYRGGIDDIDAETVEKVSRGRIRFTPASGSKAPGSIRKRVETIKELLANNRILVSANCTNIIDMFENLRKGTTDLTFIARGQPHKHIFDAISYVIYQETLEDLEDETQTNSLPGRHLISVGLGRSI